MCRSLCAFIQDFFRNSHRTDPCFTNIYANDPCCTTNQHGSFFCRSFDKLLFSDAQNYDRIVGNGFIRSAENAKHFRISRREIRNDCLAAMRFCSKIAGMHKCIPYA